jgi:AbrB family looped-hinge helix DNA binding protein
MSTMTSKGQITVPKNFRDRLGLRAGSELDFSLALDGTMVLRPVSKRATDAAKKAVAEYRKVLESVRGTADKRFSSTEEYMKFIRG